MHQNGKVVKRGGHKCMCVHETYFVDLSLPLRCLGAHNHTKTTHTNIVGVNETDWHTNNATTTCPKKRDSLFDFKERKANN